MEIDKRYSTTDYDQHSMLELSATTLAVFSSLNEAFLLLNRHLDVVYITQKAAEIGELSYDFQCKKGDNIIELMPEDRKGPIKELLTQVLHGKTIHYEIEIPKPSDRSVWLDCCYKPVRQLSSIIGICVILKDITKERLFEEEERRRKEAERKYEENAELFRTFMESTPLSAWITDSNGIMHYLNPTFCKLYNITNNGEPKSMYEIFPKDLADEYFGNNLQTINEGKLIEVLERTQKPDGTLAIYKVFKFPMKVGKDVMIGGWSVEITEDAKMQQQLLMNEENKKRAIIRSIIETQEKERRELSVQLHDNINQTLSSSKLMLEAALKHKELGQMLSEKAYKSLESAILEIRKISQSLNPSSIEDIGLKEALEDLIDGGLPGDELAVKFVYACEENISLKAADKVAIYRIIQEQLKNIVLHAEASTVIVDIKLDKQTAIIYIEDDGKGYDPKSIKLGLGLKNIQNRVEYYHGKLDIQTGINNGCKIKVVLDLSIE